MHDIHRHIDPDTLAAYALDAVSDDEFAAISSHVRACASCRREADSLAQTAALQPYGLPPAAPPVQLRERILANARADRPVIAPATRRAAATATRRGWLRWRPTLAAATFVLGVLLGWGVPAAGTALLPRPGAEVVSLTGQGSGTVVLAEGGSYVRVVVSGLPPLQPGTVYQLWLLGREAPISAGTFGDSPDGSARLAIDGLAWSPQYRAIAITIEPAGGNPAPTTPVIAAAEF